MVVSCVWTICRLRGKTGTAKRMILDASGAIFGSPYPHVELAPGYLDGGGARNRPRRRTRLLPMWTVHLMTFAFLLVVGRARLHEPGGFRRRPHHRQAA